MENNRIRNVRVIPAHIKTGKRVAIYCRVSTTRGSQADSLKAQAYGLRQIVKNEPNWTLYGVYEDQGSGGNTSRPGFQRMIWDSYDNKFDIILVKSISRFARNAVDLLETVNKLRGLGIEVVFEQENIRTSDHKQDLLIAVHTAMAQAEGESLSEAIKWGLRRGFETGESKLYTRKCFGYKHNGQGELMINEEQAIVVRKIFDLYLQGYSVDMIMKELACNNIKSPTGKEKWSKRTIQTMLTNEKYMGNVLLGKTYTGAYPNNKQKVNQGSQGQFLMKEAHELIIFNEVFEQVQEEMKRRSNVELLDGKNKRKNTHYSAKGIDESND